MPELKNQIASLLAGAPGDKTVLNKVLQLVLANFQSETGTIHTLDRQTQLLHLVAQSGLPPALLDVVKVIPVGKGIAGQVVARGGPVSICNLQKDTGEVARPGARQTGVGGALCVPMRAGDLIVGTLGIGTIRTHEFTPAETLLLEEIGKVIAAHQPGGRT
jgi:L-methionine (R)-S-oxide reductase